MENNQHNQSFDIPSYESRYNENDEAFIPLTNNDTFPHLWNAMSSPMNTDSPLVISPLSSSSQDMYLTNRSGGEGYFDSSFVRAQPSSLPHTPNENFGTNSEGQLSPFSFSGPESGGGLISPYWSQDSRSFSFGANTWQAGLPEIEMPEDMAMLPATITPSPSTSTRNYPPTRAAVKRTFSSSNPQSSSAATDSPPLIATQATQKVRNHSKSTEPQSKLRTSKVSGGATFSVAGPLSKAGKGKHRSNKSSHNAVEKQYRNRLNAHFAQLLERIPPEVVTGNGLDIGSSGRDISKAETLILAEHYIKKLQEEEKVLTGDNKELQTDFERLKARYIELGGVVMP